MRFTLFCECGRFAHNVDVLLLARLLGQHTQAVVLPAEYYAESVNDLIAGCEWIVSP